MDRKLKSLLRSEQTFLSILMILVGLFSFQLGQSSVEVKDGGVYNTESQTEVIFTDVPEPEPLATATPVVTSRNGSKYHKLDCPGADNIKQENKIYFDDIEQAKAAGYTPAANCEF